MSIKKIFNNIPVLGRWLMGLSKNRQSKEFKGSAAYWENRYQTGGNSGVGSYGALAIYKATVLNSFVKENQVASVIEFGCGDGNQLALADYPTYIGLDLSTAAIQHCIQLFKKDAAKSFYLYNSIAFEDRRKFFRAELALSLDVIYHLVEDHVFEAYMHHLFDAASRYVIIYAWDVQGADKVHVRHRKFSDWISANRKDWSFLKKDIDFSKPENACDFFIYQKNIS